MWWWLLHRITGVILLFGLLYHFAFMHFLGTENYSYESAMDRLSNPYWKAFNIIFLISVIYHGFYGINGLVTEYMNDKIFKKFAKIVIVLISLTLAFFGIKIVFF